MRKIKYIHLTSSSGRIQQEVDSCLEEIAGAGLIVVNTASGAVQTSTYETTYWVDIWAAPAPETPITNLHF